MNAGWQILFRVDSRACGSNAAGACQRTAPAVLAIRGAPAELLFFFATALDPVPASGASQWAAQAWACVL